jgi:Fe(3+) dicitrate transport protein
VSVLREAGPTTQYHAGVHRGFAPATARTEEFPLVPETGVNVQAGVRTAPRPQFSLDLALFYNRISNTLIRDDVDVFGEALFVNTADSNVYGMDAALAAFADAGPVRGFAELALNRSSARFRGGPLGGNHVPEVPRHSGSLTVGVQHREHWRASMTASHFGAFFSDKENTWELAEDAGRVPARTLLSATASTTLPMGRATRLWVQGRNLTDALYVSDVQDGLRPGAPRSLLAGLSMTF